MFQARGLAAAPEGVPESAAVDAGQRLGGRGAVPDNVRGTVAERGQGGRGRLVVAGRQTFELFWLHVVTPSGSCRRVVRCSTPGPGHLWGRCFSPRRSCAVSKAQFTRSA